MVSVFILVLENTGLQAVYSSCCACSVQKGCCQPVFSGLGKEKPEAGETSGLVCWGAGVRGFIYALRLAAGLGRFVMQYLR